MAGRHMAREEIAGSLHFAVVGSIDHCSLDPGVLAGEDPAGTADNAVGRKALVEPVVHSHRDRELHPGGRLEAGNVEEEPVDRALDKAVVGGHRAGGRGLEEGSSLEVVVRTIHLQVALGGVLGEAAGMARVHFGVDTDMAVAVGSRTVVDLLVGVHRTELELELDRKHALVTAVEDMVAELAQAESNCCFLADSPGLEVLRTW